MTNLKDIQIPSKKFEKKIYHYLNENYSRDDQILRVANELFFKFEMRRQKITHPTIVYVMMVDWWRKGYYDKLYNSDKHGDKGRLEWDEIIKNVKEYLNAKAKKNKK